MSRRALVALLVLVAGVVGYLVWPRGEEPPEELIRRNVVQMVRAAEEHDLGGIMEHISERFSTEEGRDRQEVKQLIAAELFRGRWVRIFTTDLHISVTSPGQATFTGKFIFGRSEAQKLEELAQESQLTSYEIDARLEREDDGAWRFVWAKHRTIDPRSVF